MTGQGQRLAVSRFDRYRAFALRALAVVLAAAAAGGAAAEELRVAGTGSALGTMRALGKAFAARNPGVTLTVVIGLGSGGAVRALGAGKLDVAITNRADIAGDGLKSAEYARTPFVVAVAASLGVAALSTAELTAMFRRARARWPGGERVRLVLRPATDVDTVLARALSPGMAAALELAAASAGPYIAATDDLAADAIERTPGAIGFSTLAQIRSEERALRPLALDGRAPSVEAARSGAWPHVKVFHIVIRAADEGALGGRFARFVLSPEALPILERLGQWREARGD